MKQKSTPLTSALKPRLCRFFIPGKLATGFVLGCGYMLWLGICRKPIFDGILLFILDFIHLF